MTAITKISLTTRGGRVPSEPWTGAVGAIPPQETLRPPYRHEEANLESSTVESVFTEGASPTPCGSGWKLSGK